MTKPNHDFIAALEKSKLRELHAIKRDDAEAVREQRAIQSALEKAIKDDYLADRLQRGDVGENLKPYERERFTGGNGEEVQVYYTSEKEVFLKINHQTFKIDGLCGDRDEDFPYHAWYASQLCFAVRRLMNGKAMAQELIKEIEGGV